MYLLTIDEKTGLIRDDLTNDSWKAIKCFVKLVEKKGLEALTVVALSVDYNSALYHYNSHDRFYRSLEEVYSDRKKLKIEDELITECLEKYGELQFNEDLEQDRIFREIKINILEKISRANKANDDAELSNQTRNLQKHEESLKNFQSRFNREKSLEQSISSSGYLLSRIENDINSRKKSKFIEAENSKNPNKLKLED